MVYKQLGTFIWPFLGHFLFFGVLWEWEEQVLSPRSCISSFNALLTLLLLWLDSCWKWAGIYLCEIDLAGIFVWPDAFLRFCAYCMYICWSVTQYVCDVLNYTWRKGLWHMTLLFGKFALLYHHQSCRYKFQNYINYCLPGFSLKQKSEC